MAIYTKEYMKRLLSDGLYSLVLTKSFDKITIKQICDKIGVIRGTFYNHFMDKYEALEYLTKKLLFEDFEQPIDLNHYRELYVHMIHVIDGHQEFFSRAFTIEGQNSFESMLETILGEVSLELVKEFEIDFSKQPVTREYLANYISSSLVYILKEWICHGYHRTVNEVITICDLLIDKRFMSLLMEKARKGG